MQWTCERCGLQRDDRRGSGCNGVKGQAHEWEETEIYEKRKWFSSSESDEWKNEYKRIKLFMKDETIKIQNHYLESLRNLGKKQKRYFIKIGEEYISKIRILLKEGIQKMYESNKKYSVNGYYSYDNFFYDFNHINYYKFDSNRDLSYPYIIKLRNKLINDDDFIKKHSISEY